ncbi:hypothetical protein AMAG_10606 [Allomyces macrogynus ATCC 38327]|uniref:NmrA-like domain-containing protein n=1 Tax=Allomyces macrogynus (strain ATCC 38327) TaxID=578462 RepID=A0A0L0SR09_ALLM3|nr:hypothetical protein AMAG_10606 [Allomyces macrogynus ATCC 38327]|eukprot:KNE64941.1 hypothetical protein AMAG_10606 [Allomyces macrogynus ATCC 38327]
MSANTVAIIGHRGFAGKQVVAALAASPAKHVKVLYRPGSSATDLPANVEAVEVDLADTAALTEALRGVDILISTVGAPGIADQIAWIPAIKAAGVKLFAPSDFALLYTPTERKAFGLIESKHQVEEALTAANVPFTVNNTLRLVGDARTHSISLSSTKYIGAGYASIFATTPVEKLAGRTVALAEVVANGEQIIAALTKKHGGVAPEVTVQSLHEVDEEIATSDFALAPLLRKKWGTGAFTVGSDIWEVKEYERPSIEEVILAA